MSTERLQAADTRARSEDTVPAVAFLSDVVDWQGDLSLQEFLSTLDGRPGARAVVKTYLQNAAASGLGLKLWAPGRLPLQHFLTGGDLLLDQVIVYPSGKPLISGLYLHVEQGTLIATSHS